MTIDLSRRVHRAQEILRDQMIVEAFEKIEASIYDRWKNSRITADREQAWLEYNAMKAFKRQFESVIERGKVELPLGSSATPS